MKQNNIAIEVRNLKKYFKNKYETIKAVDDISGYLWNKLVINLQNAVTALTAQTIKESFVNKDSRAIIIATMKEGINIL